MTSTLALSRPLLQWLRQDPAWARLPTAVRARAAWQAGWGSLNAHLSHSLGHSAPTQFVLQDPLLIVGPWRSGTTVMHELLTSATGCATPLTWQCMNACAFQLGTPHIAAPGLARPMDGLEIRHDSPQEDEFALLTLGVLSAYRAFWMPQRIGELHETLSPAFWLAEPTWSQVWEDFLGGVLRHSGAAARQPLILKSPNHTFRLPAILRRFPAARVVWLVRSANDVLASNRKMWRAMFEAHGLTSENDDSLEAFLVHALQSTTELIAWCSDHLSPAQWCVVRHEALLAKPDATVRAVCHHLLGGLMIDHTALAQAVARTARGRVERYAPTVNLLPATAYVMQQFDAAQGLASSRFGLEPTGRV